MGWHVVDGEAKALSLMWSPTLDAVLHDVFPADVFPWPAQSSIFSSAAPKISLL